VYGFDLIRGQQQAIRLLTTLLRKGHIPHALVFTGIDGIGKQMAAKAFAMACNCADPQPYPASQPGAAVTTRTNACGQCRTCRRILSGNHPDILHLAPSGSMIRIAVIRDLIQRLMIKPHEQGKRIVIIAGSHTMNPEASNALLKILEEPPENTILILTARQSTDLLPTIVSRCQQIRFAPLKPDVLMTLLTVNENMTPEAAAAATTLAGGSYTRAVEMVSEGGIQRRNWLANEISRLNDLPTTAQLALAEKLAADKAQLPDTLTWLVSWYRDLIVFPFQPEQVVNSDLLHQIKTAAAGADAPVLIDRMKAAQNALNQLQANANPRLTMDDLVLHIAAV
jgi:DNA polymerase-3 subunit delta'